MESHWENSSSNSIVKDILEHSKFCTAVKEGDGETIQLLFNSFMDDSISIRDICIRKEMKENFYHGMLLGLMRAEEN